MVPAARAQSPERRDETHCLEVRSVRRIGARPTTPAETERARGSFRFSRQPAAGWPRRKGFTENSANRPPKTPREHIVDIARRLFGPEHGIELEIPPRGAAPERPA